MVSPLHVILVGTAESEDVNWVRFTEKDAGINGQPNVFVGVKVNITVPVVPAFGINVEAVPGVTPDVTFALEKVPGTEAVQTPELVSFTYPCRLMVGVGVKQMLTAGDVINAWICVS